MVSVSCYEILVHEAFSVYYSLYNAQVSLSNKYGHLVVYTPCCQANNNKVHNFANIT